jgi:peptide chain release factor 1
MESTVIQTVVRECDLRVEWYSGSGAGGQHRNKTQNSCRMTHIPTGYVATSQTRSRQNSYQLALQTLTSRVEQAVRSAHFKDTAQTRKDQVGSGMRGDKIRTYRFQDDIVKDHNTGNTSTCMKIMEGNFDLLW